MLAGFVAVCLLTSGTAGSLMLAGGGSTTPAMVQEFLGIIGGVDQPILVLPLVREDPVRSGPGSVELLRENGATQVFLWSSPLPSLEQKRELAGQIFSVRGVWIPGGDQNLLIERLGAEWVQKTFRAARQRGVSFFGTSAGAMLMSNPMIGGNESEGVPKRAVGAGLVPFVVDTHYRERNRQPRLAYALTHWGSPSEGLGLSEGEWVIWNDRVVHSSGTPAWVR